MILQKRTSRAMLLKLFQRLVRSKNRSLKKTGHSPRSYSPKYGGVQGSAYIHIVGTLVSESGVDASTDAQVYWNRRFCVDRESLSLRLYLKLRFREHSSISVVTICHDDNSIQTNHLISTSCLSFKSHPHSQWRFDPHSPSSHRISFFPT